MSNRKMVIVLAVTTFIGLTGAGALNTFLPAVAKELGTTVSIVGQINTATYIIGAVLGLVLGPLADHFGLRRTIVLGALLLTVSGFTTALAIDFWTLLISRIPAGLGLMGAVSVAIASVRLPQDEQRNGIGWIVTAMPLSVILGVPLLALVAHYAHWRVSFVIMGLIALGTTALLWRYVPPDPPLPDSPFNALSVLAAYRPILRHSPSVLLYVADILRGITWFGFLIYVASFFVQELGLSLQEFALFGVSGGSAYVIGSRFGNGAFQRLSLGVLFYGSTSLMATTGLLALAGGFNLIVTLILLHIFALMGGVGFPAITIMIAEESKGGKGTTMMLRHVGIAASQACGAGIGGALLAIGGYSLFGLGLGGFALFSTVAVILATRTTARASAEPAIGN